MKNKENAGKGTFILRCDFYPQVQLLSREQRGDLLTALFAYTSGEDMPSLDGITSMCFEFIRASIDSYSERYDAKCQQNRENGKRGGRPKKADAETVNQSETYKPIVNEDNRMESEKTERFNGNTNETENVGEKENRLGTEKTKRFEKYPNETEKTKRGKKNHDYDIDYDSDGDIITHTVVTEWKGGLGGNQAAEFLAWLESAFPAITMMAEPLTEEQARDILAKFSAEDINRIIAQIDNKGAYKNKSAYSTFASFVAHDFIIKSRKATTGRKYTYNEMCDEVYSRRASSDDFQMFQMPDGTKYWQGKIAMTGPEA